MIHKAPRTVTSLISTCSQNRRAIAPIVISARSRFVSVRTSGALPGHVMAIMMLVVTPTPLTHNHAQTSVCHAPEANIAIMRLPAEPTAVTSRDQGPYGADMVLPLHDGTQRNLP
jgi:hypothetical protein